jgi:hypothetical protein
MYHREGLKSLDRDKELTSVNARILQSADGWLAMKISSWRQAWIRLPLAARTMLADMIPHLDCETGGYGNGITRTLII